MAELRGSTVVSLVEYVLQVGMVLQKTAIQKLTTVLAEEIHRSVAVIQLAETVFQKIVTPRLTTVLVEGLHLRAVIVASMTVLFVVVLRLSDYLGWNFLVFPTR